MLVYAFAATLLAAVTTASPANREFRSALAPHAPTMDAASFCPTLDSAPSHINDGLELRQAPGFAPVAAPPAEIVAPDVPAAAPAPPAIPPPAFDPLAAPAPAPAVPAEAIPPANQAVPPVLPSAVPVPLDPATTTMSLQAIVTGDDFITVQWVETHIGTLRTWVPKTQTFHFEAMSQAPLPGVGSVGMGTLTGKAGRTQTIQMVVGAAPTPTVDSKKVIGAAVAAGLAGLMV